MARAYSNITTSIWRDPEFRLLPRDAQHAYFMFLTQPDISSCGILPMTLKRWSKSAEDSTEDSVSKAIRKLSDSQFVVVDEDTEELLVRTFVKWDGGYRTPKRLMSIIASVLAIQSTTLSQVAASELTKLPVAMDAIPEAIERLSDAYREAIDSPRVVVTLRTKTPNPQPTTQIHNPQPTHLEESKDSSGTRKRATIPTDDFKPSIEDLKWASEKYPNVATDMVTEKFINYCMANEKPYKNHGRAWRNFVSNSPKYDQQASTPTHQPMWTPPPGSNLSYVEM